jgi:hypothetical protein
MRPSAAVLLLLLQLACAGPARWREPLESAPNVDAAAWSADAAWLSDPAREGRGLGSAGLGAAARFLAERFAEVGLEPGAPGGGFLQSFRMPVSIDVSEQRLTLGGELLSPGRDFQALLASESGHFAGEVVFAGYGISDAASGWDDYAWVPEGAIVLVLEGRPHAPGFEEPRGPALARRSLKLLNARQRGARAVLIAPSLDGPGDLAPEDPMSALPTRQSAGVIALTLSRDAAERLAARGGHDLAGLVQRAEARAPVDLAGARVAGAVRVTRHETEVSNVIGRLEGSDPARAGEQIVIGAHYDHLGYGAFGSMRPEARGEVHPGADDNASGAAGLIALARAFASGPRPARTLVFVAFTAEEAGLLGSARYVETHRDTVSMVNLDMIGRLREGIVTAFGADTALAFEDLVTRAAARRALAVTFADGTHGPSDHASFQGASIPALFFTTGAHEAYHTPDDRAETLEPAGAARVLGLAADVTLALANAAQAPRFAAAAPAPHEPATGEVGYGPYLGTVPAFGNAGAAGAHIAAVRPGSPADRAGLTAGDVIVSFGGSQVASLEDFAALLFAQREGSEVEIVVLRAGERIETRAVLGRRR